MILESQEHGHVDDRLFDGDRKILEAKSSQSIALSSHIYASQGNVLIGLIPVALSITFFLCRSGRRIDFVWLVKGSRRRLGISWVGNSQVHSHNIYHNNV